MDRKIKWRWYTNKQNGDSVAKLGPIALMVWPEDDRWIAALDLNTRTDTASSYSHAKTEKGAQAAAERMAKKWIEKLDKALKKL